MPAALTYLYCTQEDVQDLLSELGEQARLDDNGDATITTAEGRFVDKARSWATQQVDLYCRGFYDAAELAKSWLVNDWATVLATGRYCMRRMNPPPKALLQLLGSTTDGSGVFGQLVLVQQDKLRIPDIGRRHHDEIGWSNLVVDPRYQVKQNRVQRPTSDQTPKEYAQNVDWPAELYYEL